MDFKVLLVVSELSSLAEEVWTSEGCLISFESTTRRNKESQQLSVISVTEPLLSVKRVNNRR